MRATLVPHRSLSRLALLLVLGLTTLATAIAGAAFLYAGAWPVTFFFGLDAGLIILAFHLNNRSARRRERVEVTREAITLTQVDVRGRSRYRTFNPAWVNVDLRQARDGRNQLAFHERGERVPFAQFLTDQERADFANLLKEALLEARGGPRI